jgi:hypothetical protein
MLAFAWAVPRTISAVLFDETVTIDIAQRLHDPALCLVALFLIEVRRRFVRFNRHADHEPLGYVILPCPSEVDKTAIRVTSFSSFRAARRSSALLCIPAHRYFASLCAL